ncbi:hypothetical protein BT96DRAFT_917367 [Gymnopus androsaceus JB14]|uniref:Uncharacterized protein n=1 Tax=Gymnopus androsaceus JB14 TaxID=1447944 RepID=A0A6A4I0V2_9AGAR|nr:hypothetical protein BT96DRAFT_917367 [Gymnopus androsaceus JB14]
MTAHIHFSFICVLLLLFVQQYYRDVLLDQTDMQLILAYASPLGRMRQYSESESENRLKQQHLQCLKGYCHFPPIDEDDLPAKAV